ncbi:MAG: outer membrane beta-barrel protein [Hyalangium sp.]|uniref:outer membrane beta-barrel protein n=1 Tax=Hyalangium sp. TaxID=2028555 RepID=UPI003899B53E
MKRNGLRVLAVVLGLGVAGTALAMDDHQRGGVKVFASGGVSDFTGDVGRDVNAGPSWGLTLNLQPTHILGFELGYDGSRNTIDNGVLPDASLTRNGATGLIKLAPPFLEVVKPFVGAGLGASYVSARGALGTYNSDMMEEVPLAAGIEFNKGAVTAGLRATYRLLLDENFSPLTRDEGGLLDGSLTLGGRF